jgi:ribosomal protein S18 acetylase RimI-like enzyme
MDIEIREGIDRGFSVNLTRVNMKKYYLNHGLSWSDSDYLSFCSDKLNFKVFLDSIQIGLIVLKELDEVFYVLDIQIGSKYQNKGAGTFCLQFIQKLAISRGGVLMKLAVFSDNPAINLYRGFDFLENSRENGLVEMEKNIAEIN